MSTSTAIVLSLLTLAASKPLTARQGTKPMALGYRQIRDGAQFIAWLPSENSDAVDVCDNHVVISNNHSGNIDRPICGTSFSLGLYSYVYLACETNPGGTPATDDVINVKDGHGFDILKCTPDQSLSAKCDANIGVGQKFLCTAL